MSGRLVMARQGPTPLVLALVVALCLALPVGAGAEVAGPVQSSPLRDVDRNRIFDELDERIAGEALGELPVLALFNRAIDADGYLDLERRIGSFTTTHRYLSFPGMAASLTREQVLALARQPEVVHIEYDGEVQAHLATATESFGVNKAKVDFPGVDGDRDLNPGSYSKEDIVIAVVDTGIDANHVDLDEGKVIGFRDFVNGVVEPYDDNGHGTHVSSIAAGTGEGDPTLQGVAPAAALVGVKVLNSNGSGSFSNFVAGVDWVIQNRITLGIEVMNVSLGAFGCWDGSDIQSIAVDRAVANGIEAVVSAGNSGPRRCSVGSPAAARGALTVGAMADVGESGLYLASFSSRGPTLDGRTKPDIAGPGVRIMAADSGTKNGYLSLSGTSMSSPFVAGLAALMLDADPSLLPTGLNDQTGKLILENNQIKDRIRSTAQDWAGPGPDIDYGAGRLDAYEALDLVVNPLLDDGAGPMFPDHGFVSGSFSASETEKVHRLVITKESPLAITFVIPDWSSSTNFDIELKDPVGLTVAESGGTLRQETIAFRPSVTGIYELLVKRILGSGSYFFDYSVDLAELGPEPRDLTATPRSTGIIELSWLPSNISNLAGYNVYRGTNSGFDPTQDNKIASLVEEPRFSDSSPTSEVTHYYVVRAEDSLGSESPSSNEASAMVDVTAPAPPSGLVIPASDPPPALNPGSGWNENYIAIRNHDSAKVAGVKSEDTVKVTLQLTQGSKVKTHLIDMLGPVTTFSDPVGINTWDFNDGAIVVRATAEDTAGNVSDSSEVLTVIRDTVQPMDPTRAFVIGGHGTPQGYINQANVSSVQAEYRFSEPPEPGILRPVLYDISNPVSGLKSMKAVPIVAGSTTQQVSGLDATEFPEGPVGMAGNLFDLAGNRNSSGGGSGATKDTIAPPPFTPTVREILGKPAVRNNDYVEFGGQVEGVGTNPRVSASMRTYDGAGSFLSEIDITSSTGIRSDGSIFGSMRLGTLPAGAKSLTFSITARDDADNRTTGVSSPLRIDNMAPAGSIVINSGSVYATSTAVTLTLLATDDSSVTDMRLGNDGEGTSYESYVTTKSWTLSAGDGPKYVYVRYRDWVGNESAVVMDEIILDSTAPTVFSTSPSHGSTTASPGGSVAATFSEDVDAATVTTSTFLLRHSATGAPVTGTVSYDPATRTARFTPHSALPELTDFTAELTNGVKDLAGNSLLGHTWSFITTVSDTTAPTKPGTLTAKALKGQQIQLNWGASTDSGGSGLAGYEVWRSLNGSTFSKIATTNTTSYVDAGLNRRTTYWYYIVAFDHAGNRSAQSNTVSARVS